MSEPPMRRWPTTEVLAMALVATKIRERGEPWTRIADVRRLVGHNRFRNAYLNAVFRRGLAEGYLEGRHDPEAWRRRDRHWLRLTAKATAALDGDEWGDEARTPPMWHSLRDAVEARRRVRKLILAAGANLETYICAPHHVRPRCPLWAYLGDRLHAWPPRSIRNPDYQWQLKAYALMREFGEGYLRRMRELTDGTGCLEGEAAAALLVIDLPLTVVPLFAHETG